MSALEGGVVVPASVAWEVLNAWSGVGVFVVDPGGRIHHHNEIAARLLGLSSDGCRRAEASDSASVSSWLHLGSVRTAAFAEHVIALVQRASAGSREFLFADGRVLRLTSGALHSEGLVRQYLVVVRVNDEPVPRSVLDGIPRSSSQRREQLGPLASLSGRELEVLAMLGVGLSVEDIASTLERSVRTVNGHIGSLFRKLGVTGRPALMRIAARTGLGAGVIHEGRPEPRSKSRASGDGRSSQVRA